MNQKNEKIAEYEHFNKITDPKIIEILRKKDLDINDDNELYEFCKLVKIDISYDELITI